MVTTFIKRYLKYHLDYSGKSNLMVQGAQIIKNKLNNPNREMNVRISFKILGFMKYYLSFLSQLCLKIKFFIIKLVKITSTVIIHLLILN